MTLAGTLKVTAKVAPSIGSSFEILSNSSGSAISGTFSGMAEGSTFTVLDGATSMTFKITYKCGSSGHDMVITRTA